MISVFAKGGFELCINNWILTCLEQMKSHSVIKIRQSQSLTVSREQVISTYVLIVFIFFSFKMGFDSLLAPFVTILMVLIMRGDEFPGTDFPQKNFCMHVLLVQKDYIFASPKRILTDFSIRATWVKWNSVSSCVFWPSAKAWLYEFSNLKNEYNFES